MAIVFQTELPRPEVSLALGNTMLDGTSYYTDHGKQENAPVKCSEVDLLMSTGTNTCWRMNMRVSSILKGAHRNYVHSIPEAAGQRTLFQFKPTPRQSMNLASELLRGLSSLTARFVGDKRSHASANQACLSLRPRGACGDTVTSHPRRGPELRCTYLKYH